MFDAPVYDMDIITEPNDTCLLTTIIFPFQTTVTITFVDGNSLQTLIRKKESILLSRSLIFHYIDERLKRG